MNGEEAIEAVAGTSGLHVEGWESGRLGFVEIPKEARDELVRLARIGLAVDTSGKDHEKRCIAFVATVGRTIRDDKATISLYNTDGEVKFLVETSGGLAFKGRAGELLDALDDCITEGWRP